MIAAAAQEAIPDRGAVPDPDVPGLHRKRAVAVLVPIGTTAGPDHDPGPGVVLVPRKMATIENKINDKSVLQSFAITF